MLTFFERLDSSPYHLIIELIRQASIAEEEGRTCKGVSPSAISDLMAIELANIAQFGPPAEARTEIFLQCVEDLRDRNASATGSIIVMCALLRMYLCLPQDVVLYSCSEIC